MNEYRLKITVRNNLLLSAIEAAGYKTQTEFANAAFLSVSRVNNLIALREPPIGPSGDFTPTAKKVMEALGAAPSDLWTDAQLYIKLRRNSASAEVNAESIKSLMGESLRPIQIEAPDDFAERLEATEVVKDAIRGLTSQQAFVLRERFYGEKSLEEVAERMGLTRERIRQIEMKAMRRLRHPVNGERLRGLLNEPPVEFKQPDVCSDVPADT